MAGRVKAGGAPKKPAKKKAAAKPKGAGRTGKNTLSAEEAAEAFEEIFNLHAELETVSGEVRKRIADEYATVAKRLDVPKKIIKHEFALEKHRRAIAKLESEFDGRDRDALMKLAQIFGEDSPFGEFALRAAGRAKRDDFGGSTETTELEPDDGPEAGDDE
jgi:hypothetical protein